MAYPAASLPTRSRSPMAVDSSPRTPSILESSPQRVSFPSSSQQQPQTVSVVLEEAGASSSSSATGASASVRPATASTSSPAASHSASHRQFIRSHSQPLLDPGHKGSITGPPVLVKEELPDFASSDSSSISDPEEWRGPDKLLDDTLSDISVFTTYKGASALSAAFNFVNTIVGSGIIGLAFAVSRTGFVMGIILLCLVALATDYSCRIMLRTGCKVDIHSYESLSKHVFGNRGFYVVCVAIFLVGYGAMVSYLVIIGQTLTPVFGLFFGDDHVLANRNWVILIFTVGVILPLSLLRDLSRLAYTSFLSMMAVGVIIIIVLIKAPSVSVDASTQPNPYSFAESSVFSGIGTMAFAFVCHHNSFNIFRTLKKQTMQEWEKVSKGSLFTAWVLCMVLALTGYLNFFSETEANILDNFAPDDNVVNAARILLAVTMFFTTPMENYVCRHAAHELIWGPPVNGRMSAMTHYGITFLLVGSTLGIAEATDNLGFVFELTGAVAASLIGYIFPIAMYFQVFGVRNVYDAAKECWDPESEHHEDTFYKRVSKTMEFIVPAIIIVVGIAVFFIGSATTIISAINGDEEGGGAH